MVSSGSGHGRACTHTYPACIQGLYAEKMSYGAPWEQGVGAAGTMPQCDMEVPELVPDVSEVELNTKEARRGRQRGQRQQHQEEKASHRERSLVDCDRCFDRCDCRGSG